MKDFSKVEVRDDHVEALRSWFLGELDPQPFLDPENESESIAFTLMMYAAFAVVVRRRFTTYTLHQIVRYVADLRISRQADAEAPDVDPRVTENLIRSVLGDPAMENEPELPETAENTEKAVVAELAVLEDLLESAVGEDDGEQFLQDAADYARQWLAAKKAQQAAQRG